MKLKSSWHLLFQKVSSAQIAAKNLFVEPKLRTSRVGEKGRRLSRNTSTGMAVICIVERWQSRPYSGRRHGGACDCRRHSSIVMSIALSQRRYLSTISQINISIFPANTRGQTQSPTLTARQAAKERQALNNNLFDGHLSFVCRSSVAA